MAILVVKTSDGDLYFDGSRERYRSKASDLALEQVLVSRRDDFSEEEIASVEAANRAGWRKLYAALVDVGAIKEREFQT